MAPLSAIIREEIERDGPIPFSRFMELALYHPEQGYYRRERDPFGRAGDFFTNSQLQPVFGRLLAQRIESWRRELGSPHDFQVLELGSGRGETAREVRRCMPDVPWTSVDVGAEWPGRPITGVVFSNEFFDALPVDCVERRGDGWVEWPVDWNGERFSWRVSSEIEQRKLLPAAAEGARIETCERALETIERIARTLKRGFVLTIDYGYTHAEITRAARFPEGSLMSYSRHQAAPDVLLDPGSRDITAHVNFTALIERGEALGLRSDELESQQAFLAGIGEQDNFAYALDAQDEEQAMRLRMQLKTLLFGMGETFRALVQRKG